MKVIQPYTDPITGTSSTLVGIIRGSKKEVYTDFCDGKRYINAWHRVNYIHAIDEKPIWLDVVFRIVSSDLKTIEYLESSAFSKKGELVLCQSHLIFEFPMIPYTIESSPSNYICDNVYDSPDIQKFIEQRKKYYITKTSIDELFELRHYRELLEPYREVLENAMRAMRTN